MKQWYEYKEDERVKEIYSKYSLKQFWDWWNDDCKRVMEIRIKNWELIKETAQRFNLPYSTSGVYVWSHVQLINVISYTREKATVWFGIQPRKKNISKKGWSAWGVGDKGGSSDYNISELAFLFIDIDRIKKGGVASNDDLKFCDKLANKILDVLGNEDWNKNYCKICSGHGLQLLLKFDVPFKMPIVKFNKANDIYLPEYNEEFDKIKLMMKTGIGKQIKTFSNKFKDYKVELDMTGFTIGRVGALPVTKNYKYNTFRWRGIIELVEGENIGLSDYILEFAGTDKVIGQRNIFGKSKALIPKLHIRKGKLEENKLCKFMLENDFPAGYINNTLWLQLKILLRESKFDLNSREFRTFYIKLKAKHGRAFSLNMPVKSYVFNQNVINNYCIDHAFIPVFELWPEKNKRIDYNLIFNFDEVEYGNDSNKVILQDDTTLYDDMLTCKSKLINGEIALNRIIFISFCKKCIKKYDIEKTKYLMKYVFPEFFTRE